MKRILSVLLAAVLIFSFSNVAFAAKRGDVNGDGTVNSADALEVLRYSVGTISKIGSAADVNGDGKVNASDALLILQISVGTVIDAKYLAKFSLTAKVNDKVYDSSDVISVKPDATVSVTLSFSNNYYAGPLSAQIYYNSNIFSSAPSAQFNTEGRLYETAGKAYCTFNDWSGMAEQNKEKCWPDFDEPKLTEFKENHKFLRITMTPNSMFASEPEKNINEDLITVHFKVSAKAKKGTTGQIVIPVESQRRKDYLQGFLFCSVYETDDILGKANPYIEGLAYDCSKAVLNFKVS